MAAAAPAIEGIASPDLLEPRMAEAYTYWLHKRGARAMPARADIDPVEIPRLLASVVLVDVREPTPVYRLVGTRQVSARGFDPTGRPVAGHTLAADDPEMRARVLGNYAWVVANARPYYAGREVRGAEHSDVMLGGPLTAVATLFLPLADDGVRVDTVFCYTDFRRA